MNYELIKKDYENTETSFAKLGVKYKTDGKALQRYAKKDNWKKFNANEIINLDRVEIVELESMKPKTEIDVIADIKSVLGGYYRNIDDILIMAYADSYVACLELMEDVKLQGRTIISERTNTRYINPSVNLLQMEKNNLIRIGKELGVTTSSRIRLGMDIENHEEKKEPSLFDLVKDIEYDPNYKSELDELGLDY